MRGGHRCGWTGSGAGVLRKEREGKHFLGQAASDQMLGPRGVRDPAWQSWEASAIWGLEVPHSTVKMKNPENGVGGKSLKMARPGVISHILQRTCQRGR